MGLFHIRFQYISDLKMPWFVPFANLAYFLSISDTPNRILLHITMIMSVQECQTGWYKNHLFLISRLYITALVKYQDLSSVFFLRFKYSNDFLSIKVHNLCNFSSNDSPSDPQVDELQVHTRYTRVGPQIGSDWPKMGQIWDFLRSVFSELIFKKS